MAITDAGKLFESEVKTKSTNHTLGLAIKEGTLICIALAGKRSGAYLNVSSITDSAGNVWDWRMFQSQYRAAGVAWCRVASAMSTSDFVTVNWNGTPTYAWKSAHAFLNASGTPTDEDTNNGNSSTASVALSVTGSDWLAFGVVILPDATSGGLTILNSGISQDDNAHSGTTPWAECFSRNGTTGSTYTAGATLPSSQQWGAVAVSFPYLAMPASPVRSVPGVVGI